jgi:ATP-dependent Lon protease
MDKLLAPLLTRFSVIHLKSYTKEEFVEIVVKVLNRDEGIEKYMI